MQISCRIRSARGSSESVEQRRVCTHIVIITRDRCDGGHEGGFEELSVDMGEPPDNGIPYL